MSKKVTKILVPDMLPNNLRSIREMRQLEIKDVAEKLEIDRNFLSGVEAETKNFSGKTTIKALKFYGVNFYKMYDVKEKRILDVTDYFENVFRTTLPFDPMDIFKGSLKLKDQQAIQDTITAALTEDYEQLKNNNLIINCIKQVAKKNNVKGVYSDLNLIGSSYKDNKLFLDLEVTFKEKRTEKHEFDINFVKNENHHLADLLRYRGFPEVIRTIEKDIDGEVIRIDGNAIQLDKPYKLVKGNDIKKYTESDRINLSDKNLKIKYDEETNEPLSIKFKAVKPDMNNLRAIRAIANLSIEEMHKCLGLTYNGYINLELGNQKISTKIMWRLVKKLQIPLELIINIDEFYEKYCEGSTKKRGSGDAGDDESDE
jgi:transcriptional regulator with XRE-family HTH domain